MNVASPAVLVTCALVTALVAARATGVVGAATTVGSVELVSVPDPFSPADCGQYPADQASRPRNAPRELVVAVNPANPGNIVVANIVDDNLSNLVRASLDGGRSWHTSLVRGISACTGGAALSAVDPSVAFSTGGSVLCLASQNGDNSTSATAGNTTTGIVVNRSFDGGTTWSQPTTLQAPDGMRGDNNFITADPVAPQTAYIIYARSDVWGTSSTVSHLYMRRTDDAGATWSAAFGVYDPPAGLGISAAKIWRGADGILVDVFWRYIPQGAPPPERPGSRLRHQRLRRPRGQRAAQLHRCLRDDSSAGGQRTGRHLHGDVSAIVRSA